MLSARRRKQKRVCPNQPSRTETVCSGSDSRQLKFAILGDRGVGKSSLIRRFVEDDLHDRQVISHLWSKGSLMQQLRVESKPSGSSPQLRRQSNCREENMSRSRSDAQRIPFLLTEMEKQAFEIPTDSLHKETLECYLFEIHAILCLYDVTNVAVL